MGDLFKGLSDWFANNAGLMSFIPDWLAGLIAPILDLFKNLAD